MAAQMRKVRRDTGLLPTVLSALVGQPQSIAQQSDGRFALRTVREQLNTLGANGVLDATSRDRLEAVIDAEIQRLAEMAVRVSAH